MMVLDRQATCVDCDQPFEWSSKHLRDLGHDTTPRRCGACRAKRNRKPHVARRLVAHTSCAVLQFKPEWLPARGNTSYLTHTERAAMHGPRADGRFDMKTQLPVPNVSEGCLVSVRLMEATSEGGRPYWYVVLGIPSRATRPEALIRRVEGPPPPEALWSRSITKGGKPIVSYCVVPIRSYGE